MVLGSLYLILNFNFFFIFTGIHGYPWVPVNPLGSQKWVPMWIWGGGRGPISHPRPATLTSLMMDNACHTVQIRLAIEPCLP